MKKVPPFVANSSDDLHCVNAVFRMVHQHFLGTDLTWEEIDRLTHAIPGQGTWTFVGLTEFVKKGIKIIHFEPIDYKRLYGEGISYLKQVVGTDTANYYIKKSNFISVIPYIPEYLKFVKNETRKATTEEIIAFLKQEHLVGVEVNSDILNYTPGFNLHYILLYDFDGTHLILHDPGLPPIKSRKITTGDFEKCFNFPGSNGGITVFSKKTIT